MSEITWQERDFSQEPQDLGSMLLNHFIWNNVIAE